MSDNRYALTLAGVDPWEDRATFLRERNEFKALLAEIMDGWWRQIGGCLYETCPICKRRKEMEARIRKALA